VGQMFACSLKDVLVVICHNPSERASGNVKLVPTLPECSGGTDE